MRKNENGFYLFELKEILQAETVEAIRKEIKQDFESCDVNVISSNIEYIGYITPDDDMRFIFQSNYYDMDERAQKDCFIDWFADQMHEGYVILPYGMNLIKV